MEKTIRDRNTPSSIAVGLYKQQKFISAPIQLQPIFDDERIFSILVPNFTGGREGRLAYENSDRCLNDAGVVATFEAIAQLQPYLDPQDRTLLQSTNHFLNGEAAMWIGGSWELKTFKQAQTGFEFSVFAAPPPQGQPKYIVFHTDLAVGLNANSPHQKEAKEFLQWLTTSEAAHRITNQLIGNFALHKKKPLVRDPHAQRFFSFLEDRKTDVVWSFPKLDAKIPSGNTLIKEASVAVTKGEMTPQEAANHLQQGLAEWYTPAQTCGENDG